MFYKEEDVANVIKCGICSQTYKDPRLLPCGESACHECIIDSILRNQEKQFECVFCKEIHQPCYKNSEFYPNKGLYKLVEKKAEEVYRFEGYENLKHKLGEIKTKCEGLETNTSNGIYQIQEHCNKMRNDVHLRAEIVIEQVHQITESLIAEIDEYEKECVDSFNSKIDEYRNKFGKLLVETNDFYNNTSKYINEFKVDKNLVDESLANANELICKLNQESFLFEKLKFNERIIQFTNSSLQFVKELIGSLSNKRLMFEEFKFDKYKKNLNFLVLDHDDCGQKTVFYIDNEENLNIDLLDSNGKLIKHIPNWCALIL
jgi:hypothetical protein